MPETKTAPVQRATAEPMKRCERKACGRLVPQSKGWGVYCSRDCGMEDMDS